MSEGISSHSAHLSNADRSEWLARGFGYHERQGIPTPLHTKRDIGRHEPSSDIEPCSTILNQTKLPASSWPQRPLPAHRTSPTPYCKAGCPEYTKIEGLNGSKASPSLRQKSDCVDRNARSQGPHLNSKDPEKASGEYPDDRRRCHDRESQILHTTIPYEGDDQECEYCVEKHSIWILVYLSILAPFLALFFSVYTVVASTSIVLCIPICFFCSDCRPFRSQLHCLLSPPIAFQLGLIYSDISVSDLPGDQTAMLAVINTCSPFYALWISTSAWVAAGFWVFTTVMGDPDGQDGKDDGRDAVMSVRRWWERWLAKALR